MRFLYFIWILFVLLVDTLFGELVYWHSLYFNRTFGKPAGERNLKFEVSRPFYHRWFPTVARFVNVLKQLWPIFGENNFSNHRHFKAVRKQ